MREDELIKETMMLDYSQLVMNNVYCHKEIERITKQNKALNEVYELTKKEYIRLNNILKEVREYTNNIMFETKAEEKIQDDILEILDKGE